MTPEPEESIYSSVATLHSLHIVVFLAELNGLRLMQGDIGNAYLESYTQEKVYFIAGPEFGYQSGHTFIIDKALYGLQSSGLRFERNSQPYFVVLALSGQKWTLMFGCVIPGLHGSMLLSMSMTSLLRCMIRNVFFDDLQGPQVRFTMKGVGQPSYHLGADFFHDDDSTLSMGTQTYSKHLCANFESLYGEPPKTVFSPLDHEDHPKLDDSPLCGPNDIAKFQSLIGACQWMISLC